MFHGFTCLSNYFLELSFLEKKKQASKNNLSLLSLPQPPKIQHLVPCHNNDLQVTTSHPSSSGFP